MCSGNGGSGKLGGNGGSRKHSRRAATNSSSSTSVGCALYRFYVSFPQKDMCHSSHRSHHHHWTVATDTYNPTKRRSNSRRGSNDDDGVSRRVCLEHPGMCFFFFHINLTNGYLNTIRTTCTAQMMVLTTTTTRITTTKPATTNTSRCSYVYLKFLLFYGLVGRVYCKDCKSFEFEIRFSTNVRSYRIICRG
jgi:hypothetical protein